jgi:hypothetical protein
LAFAERKDAPVPKSSDEQRIVALEEALLEYVGKYGLTNLAQKAFQIGQRSEQRGLRKGHLRLPIFGTQTARFNES